MIRYIKNMLMVTCCSFTVMMLYFTILPESLVPELKAITVLQTFTICLSCGIIIIALYHANLKCSWLSHTIAFILIWLTVFGMGGLLFNAIPFEIPVVLSVTVSIIIIFIFCEFMTYTKNQDDAKKINAMLRQIKHKE